MHHFAFLNLQKKKKTSPKIGYSIFLNCLLHVTEACVILLHVTSGGSNNMSKNTAERVQKHRNALRASGLRPIQIWVPDTRKKGFPKECHKQSLLLKRDSQEKDVLEWIEKVSDDQGWQ